MNQVKNNSFMKGLFIVPALLIAYLPALKAQNFSTVKIEFEKTTAFHAYLKELNENIYNQLKDQVPQNSVKYYDFTGDSTHSIYLPGSRKEKEDPSINSWLVGDDKITYNDYKNRMITSQKTVFDQVFLMKDSLVKIKWKLTSDRRIIAGFDCRKAIGILDDTVAVFAFYTDDLIISGGPEGIQGLPGMILGVGIPRLHTTWFATRVEVIGVNLNIVRPPTRGKMIKRADMMKELNEVLKQKGNSYGSKRMVEFSI